MLFKQPSNTVYTVSQLTAYIKSVLEKDPLLRIVSVKGEISNLRRPSSGHVYFTLKDKGACLRCVLFRRRAATVPFQLQEGANVVLRGDISLYERDGCYQLYVMDVEPLGIGSLFIAFQQLKEKLEQEGLFAAANKLPLPAMPARIAIVTSAAGAALHDILTTLRRRFPVEAVVVPTLVQGDSAPQSITAAIVKAAAIPRAELIILSRGGGSLEELWSFNDEQVARAIAACPLPIITGVGHETDFTIADFVADYRAPTPTGAAQKAVPEVTHLQTYLDSTNSRMVREAGRRLKDQDININHLERRLRQNSPYRRLMHFGQFLDNIEERLHRQGLQQLHRKAEKLLHIQERLETASPLQVMNRGFAYCTNSNGQLIRSVLSLSSGEELRIRFADGTAYSQVEKIEEEKL